MYIYCDKFGSTASTHFFVTLGLALLAAKTVDEADQEQRQQHQHQHAHHYQNDCQPNPPLLRLGRRASGTRGGARGRCGGVSGRGRWRTRCGGASGRRGRGRLRGSGADGRGGGGHRRDVVQGQQVRFVDHGAQSPPNFSAVD